MCRWKTLNFDFLKKIVNIFRETGESFLEICPENKRDRKTLEALIQKRVRVGTKILTDGWAGYKQLGKLGNIFGRFGFQSGHGEIRSSNWSSSN